MAFAPPMVACSQAVPRRGHRAYRLELVGRARTVRCRSLFALVRSA